MTKSELADKIQRYLPEGTATYVVDLMVQYKVQLKLNKPRTSKYGDYRAPYREDRSHRITVNKDLNPFSFLTTFLHEVAHLVAFEKFKHTIEAHGKEWKQEFKILLAPVVEHHQIPDDIQKALKQYMHDPSASSCSDTNLMKVLARYDKDQKPLLEQIPTGSIFKLETGRIFKKGDKLRSWYRCFEQPGGREYRVSGISKVEIISG
ncbi:MAG: SprT-like domain-containing protein [Bacteroidota bacterium]